jgi:hypothetical protein
MRKPPRLEERIEARRAAHERTRARVAAIRSGAPARNAPLAQPKASGVSSESPSPDVPAATSGGDYRAARVGPSVLRIARSEVSESLTATRPLVTLSDLLLDCAQHRSRQAVLLWPAQPTVLPLAHALATTARWAAGDKQGLRSLWYPCASNVFHGLNDYFFDSEDFSKLTARLYEEVHRPNADVARSMRQKDSLFFAVKSADAATRPSLAELLPQFFYAGKSESWESFSSRYLDEFLRTLKRRQHAHSVRHIDRELGQPETAPDALFALHYSLERSTLLRHLRKCAARTGPEIAIVPLMRRDRGRLQRWPATLKAFVAIVERAFGRDPPGILVITDEPVVYQRSLQILGHASKKNRHPAAAAVASHAVLWPNEDDGWRPSAVSEFHNAEPRNFDVQLVDEESSHALGQIASLLGEPDLPDAVREDLKTAQRFVSMLSTLCGTRAVLAQWIARHENRERAEALHTWLPYRQRLASLAGEGEFGPYRDRIERILAAIDVLWQNADHGVPMLHAIVAELRQLERSSKRLMVVLPSDKERQLLHLYLADTPLWKSTRLVDLQDSERVRIEAPWSAGMRLENFHAKRMVFAGLFRSAMPVLLTENRLPKEIAVVLTTRNADYLLQAFEIVDRAPGLKRVRARVQALREQILRCMTRRPRSRLIIDDFARDPNPAQRRPASAASGLSAAYSWQIHLEDGELLFLGADSVVYEYDPRHGTRLDRAFKPTNVSNLASNAEILIAPAELKDALEDALQAHGSSTREAGSADVLLRAYHQDVRNQLAALFPNVAVAEQERAVRLRMRDIAGSEAALPVSVRYWIDLENLGCEGNKPITPHGPQGRAHFLLFAQAIEIRETTAILYWEEAIVRARAEHSRDGRRLANRWEHVLLDATAVLSCLGLSSQEVDRLLQMAAAHVRRVVGIIPPAAGSNA